MELQAYIATAVIAIYTIYREITTYNKHEHSEADGLTERVKNLYKEENSELIRRIEKLERENETILSENKELKASVQKMYERSQQLVAYLERRDPDDIAYRKRGEQIFEVVEKVVPLIIETNENMNRLVLLLETHFKPLTDVKPAEKVQEALSKGGDNT